MTISKFRKTSGVACWAAVLLWLSCVAAFGETPLSPRPLAALVKEWNLVLERSDKGLAKAELTDERLAELRQDLVGLRMEIAAAVAQAAPEVQSVRDELSTLGTPPAEGAPPESPAVAARRKSINEQLANLDGGIKEGELISARAEHLLEDINVRQRQRFTERILTRGGSPLSPEVWRKAWPELQLDLELIRASFEQRLVTGQLAERGQSMARNLTLGLVAAFILVWPLRLWLLRRFGYVSVEQEPTHGQRLRVALFTGFIRTLMPTAATIAVYLAVKASGLLSEQNQLLADTVLSALVFLYFVTAFCHAAVAPFAPEWRLVRLDDAGARIIGRVIPPVATVFALDLIIDQLSDLLAASVQLTLVHKFISGLLISGLLLILLQPQVWRVAGEGCDDPARPWRRLRSLLRVLVLAIPLSAVMGYVALSRMLATQLVLTAGLYVAVVLVRRIGAEALEQALSRQSGSGLRVREAFNLSDDGVEILRFWLGEILGFFVILTGVLLLLVLWGAGGDDLAAWLNAAFFGFKVGSITISLADLVMAIFLFGGLVAVTRLLQHWLEHRIFPRTRLDSGIRHSVRSATGYVGFTLAATAAVSTMGIDLSNLAMIAGALSVGIGFGLQNIVNNFVSGLILLIERPIKVGDWVVIGEHQGYVKKISVRATEISTFDRASVFVPNSSLISGMVMNRTYADKVGRVVLTLALPLSTDAGKVRELVLSIAGSHPGVLRNPAPSLYHKGFADNLLNLELVAFIHDVDRVKGVTSDLWFEIAEQFRREEIAIPSPGKDVRVLLQDEQLDRLLAALASRGAARDSEGGGQGAEQADADQGEQFGGQQGGHLGGGGGAPQAAGTAQQRQQEDARGQ
ncbi:MAG: mechanosensitive ion channel family protein [Methylococcaceae bacterium]|nr:mechanosensitive ion channel family protein [Methylococcaceae bacterium]